MRQATVRQAIPSERHTERGGGARRPKVSLCIPAYQAGEFLRDTLDSVLAQDFPDLEILV
ncbi:MAG: glycosyltransferase, partial [Mycolicibacterium aromaticivorans]|nr:glycosyltransferase [Mycolicibacterium aromaticivorans]